MRPHADEERSLRRRLQRREVVFGSWVTLAHPGIAEIMARAGFDWLTVDLEHSTITIGEAEQLIRTIELSGVTPLVRLSTNDAIEIKRVMDAGAHGVIVPMVNSVEDARRAVDAVRYPPHGLRTVGLARAQGYGATFADYRERHADHAVVIVQIEHRLAVENLDAILAVPGVDGYIVGPYDLSASFGVPGQFDHPLMTGALETIYRTAAGRPQAGGMHIVEPDVAAALECVRRGLRFIGYSLDIRVLDSHFRGAVPALRGAHGI